MRGPESHRANRLARWGVFVTVAIVAGVCSTYTPLFAARDILVAGTDIPRAEVLRIAGIDDRINVVHLDVEEVARRLEGDPRILDADVARSLPGTIRIGLTARAPVAVVGRPASFVGPDGVVIGPASRYASFPVIRGGDLRTGAAAAAAMSPALRASVASIVVRSDRGIGVQLDAGFSADLGGASELDAKAASLAALLAWVTEEGVRVESVDVTVPGSPTAELENGVSVAPKSEPPPLLDGHPIVMDTDSRSNRDVDALP